MDNKRPRNRRRQPYDNRDNHRSFNRERHSRPHQWQNDDGHGFYTNNIRLQHQHESTYSHSRTDNDNNQNRAANNDSANNQSTGSPRNIPGFYYDPVKKKYFKQSKDHPPPSIMVPVTTDNVLTSSLHKPSNYFTKLIFERPISSTHQAKVRRLQQQAFINKFSTVEQTSLIFENDYRGCEGYIKRIKTNISGNKLAVIKKGVNNANEILQVYTVKQQKLLMECSLEPTDHGLVHSMCWCPQDPDDNALLFTICSNDILANRNPSRRARRVFNLGYRKIFDHENFSFQCIIFDNEISCVSASSNVLHPNMFAVECNGGLKFGDIEQFRHAPKSPFHKMPSQPQALEFSRHSSTIAVGFKSGHVRLYDFNSRALVGSRMDKSKLFCVDDLHWMQDENYILVSNWQGQIYMYDIRMGGIVVEYEGHVNNYSRLHFRVDEREEYLFCTGSDKMLRIWEINSGKIVKTVTAPSLRNRDEKLDILPSIDYCKSWAGFTDCPGLLYGFHKDVVFWPLACS